MFPISIKIKTDYISNTGYFYELEKWDKYMKNYNKYHHKCKIKKETLIHLILFNSHVGIKVICTQCFCFCFIFINFLRTYNNRHIHVSETFKIVNVLFRDQSWFFWLYPCERRLLFLIIILTWRREIRGFTQWKNCVLFLKYATLMLYIYN